MPGPERVLVKATNWLGDVVMSLPALRAVRHAFPRSRLTVLVQAPLASFFDGAAWIDEVIPYTVSRGMRRLADLRRIVAAIRVRRFDLAILFPTSFESALWPFLARVPRRVGYARDGRGRLLTDPVTPSAEALSAHQARWYLELLRSTLGIAGAADAVAPDVDEAARVRVRDWLTRRRGAGRLVALAPAAAYGPAKEWPVARYAAVVDRLGARGVESVLVGAPSERRRCEEVAAASRHGALVAAGETTVAELLALLSLCDGFAGNDSGSMHVAGALGRPTVGIFGSTSPARTSPLGARTRVLHRPIACSPCLDRTCRFGHYDCFKDITAGDVVQALLELGALG